jgi:hypothetical protein
MSKRFSVYLGALLALYLAYSLSVFEVPDYSERDFPKFYGSALLYLEGQSLYAPLTVDRFVQWNPDWGEEPPLYYPNLNPPFLTLLVLPFTLFRFPIAMTAWSVLSLLVGMIGILWIERETRAGPADPVRSLGFLILLLAYYPTFASVNYGQLTLFLLLGAVAAWVAYRGQHEILAGMALGFLLSVKLFFGLFALVLLTQKRFKAVISMALTFSICWSVSVLVFGIESLIEYRSALAMVSWHSTNWNASYMGFFTRLLGGAETKGLVHAPVLGRSLSALASVFTAALLAVLTWKRSSRSTLTARDFSFSLTLVAMFLLSPLGWIYYFPLLLLPMILIWANAPRFPDYYRSRRILLFGGILSALPVSLYTEFEDPPFYWYIAAQAGFSSLLMVGGLLVYFLYQLNVKRPAED